MAGPESGRARGSGAEGTSLRTVRGFGHGPLVLAFLTVQALAFALTYLAGVPTVYAGVALVSAAAAAHGAGWSRFGVLAATVGGGLLVILGLPLALFVVRQDPALVAEKAASPAVHRTLYLAVYGPLLAALASLALGIPLAWVLSRGFPGRAVVESLVDLPLVVPHSVAGLIVLFGFGAGGAFPQLSILGTTLGLVLALTFVSAPFAVNAVREAFEAIDPRIEYAARVHGASEFETVRRVTGPLAARGVITGGVLAWARAVSEFGAVAVVAYSVRFFYPPAGTSVSGQHAPVFVYNTYIGEGLAESGAVAILLLALAAVLFLLLRWATGDLAGPGGLA